ncbi:hypothetical protein QFC21_005206 [Naganishia friedmannii]|uniref:Uncharacterized protein n=1 Tax=Naganishia friedmannii TaxID=89922 RepID=A0ACC2VAK9_9TREE|nr:hypothetical protein QFC21_005206 [Naganishia friedmannii]
MSRSAFHSHPFLHLNSPSGNSVYSESASINSAGTLCGSAHSSIAPWDSPISDDEGSDSDDDNDVAVVTPMYEIEPEFHHPSADNKATAHTLVDVDGASVIGIYGTPAGNLEDRKVDLDGDFLDTVSGRDNSQDAEEAPIGNLIVPKALRRPRTEEAKAEVNGKAKSTLTTATFAYTYMPDSDLADVGDSTPATASCSTASLESLIAALPVLPDRVSPFELDVMFPTIVPMTARLLDEHFNYAQKCSLGSRNGRSSTTPRGEGLAVVFDFSHPESKR